MAKPLLQPVLINLRLLVIRQHVPRRARKLQSAPYAALQSPKRRRHSVITLYLTIRRNRPAARTVRAYQSVPDAEILVAKPLLQPVLINLRLLVIRQHVPRRARKLQSAPYAALQSPKRRRHSVITLYLTIRRNRPAARTVRAYQNVPDAGLRVVKPLLRPVLINSLLLVILRRVLLQERKLLSVLYAEQLRRKHLKHSVITLYLTIRPNPPAERMVRVFPSVLYAVQLAVRPFLQRERISGQLRRKLLQHALKMARRHWYVTLANRAKRKVSQRPVFTSGKKRKLSLPAVRPEALTPNVRIVMLPAVRVFLRPERTYGRRLMQRLFLQPAKRKETRPTSVRFADNRKWLFLRKLIIILFQ